MDRWRDDMMRFWNRMTQEFGQNLGTGPAHYVAEAGDEVVVEVELPGVDPETVELEADAECLTIRGHWPSLRLGVESARRQGPFALTVMFPTETDPDQARAHFTHGLLTVEMPKATGPRRRLDIQVHSGSLDSGTMS